MKTKQFPSHKGIRGFMTRMLERSAGFSGMVVDKKVKNNDVIFGLKVFHFPGHTPGIIALLDEETEALFVGDIINSDKKGNGIIPPKKSYSIDYKQALASSIKMFETIKPSVILPGHRVPFLKPELLIYDYITKFKAK